MRGVICLIQLSNQKVVPALCLTGPNDNYLFTQLRKATEEEIPQPILSTSEASVRPSSSTIKTPKTKHIKHTIYIGKPKGVKWESVAMTNRLHRVKNREIIKEIAEVPGAIVGQCLNLTNEKKKINSLQKELHLLKRKITFAQMNNEDDKTYRKRVTHILNELGYRKNKNHTNKIQPKAYENYRVVPDRGRIKIYLGGR